MRKCTTLSLATAAALLAGSRLVSAVTYPDLVYYAGTDQHVHELRYDGTAWHTTDINNATGAPNAASGTHLVGHVYQTADNVYYIASDSHVHELWYGSGTWHTGDVTSSGKAPNAASGSPLTGEVFGSSDDLFYVATDGHIHELSWYGRPGSWHTGDVTVSAGAPNPISGGALTSHVYGNAETIYYIATDDHVHQMYFPKNRD